MKRIERNETVLIMCKKSKSIRDFSMMMKKAIAADLKVKLLLLPIQSYVNKSAVTHA